MTGLFLRQAVTEGVDGNPGIKYASFSFGLERVNHIHASGGDIVKNFLRVIFFVAVCGLSWSTANAETAANAAISVIARDCYSDGYQLGVMESEGFCMMWERMYNDDAVVMPYRVSAELCSQQLVWACKQAMADHTRQYYPLCTWLVRNGWRNSRGESATTAWASWQRGACSFVVP